MAFYLASKQLAVTATIAEKLNASLVQTDQYIKPLRELRRQLVDRLPKAVASEAKKSLLAAELTLEQHQQSELIKELLKHQLHLIPRLKDEEEFALTNVKAVAMANLGYNILPTNLEAKLFELVKAIDKLSNTN